MSNDSLNYPRRFILKQRANKNKGRLFNFPFQAGETWSPDDDICSICECVAGEVKCTPVCEIPVCEEVSELELSVCFTYKKKYCMYISYK